MEKLFLTSNEVADLLNVSQQQAYKIIRDMNKQLESPTLTVPASIAAQYSAIQFCPEPFPIPQAASFSCRIAT